MKVFSSKKRVAAIGVVTAATLVGGGMAYAYWTTTGSGTGSASTANVEAVDNLSFTQNLLAEMYPGDQEQDLIVTVTNDNADQSAFVGTLTAYVTGVGTCDGSDFLINGDPADAPVELNWVDVDLAAGGSASTPPANDPLVNTIQFNNKTTAQDDCQNVDVTINYNAS